MAGSLADVQGKIRERRERLGKVFEQAGPDLDLSQVSILDGDPDEKRSQIHQIEKELTDLGIDYDRLLNIALIAKNNDLESKRFQEPVSSLTFPGQSRPSPSDELAKMGLKRLIQTHDEYKRFREDRARTVSIDLPIKDFKTLVALTTAAPQALRQPGYVDMALEERTVADLMLQGNTDRPVIEYYEETTFTNAAAIVDEGAAKPESAVAFTLRTETVRKIAHFIPATKESMDDIPWLESQLRGRMAFGVQRTEEAQLISGDGTGINLRGILNRVGIQTQAKGADPVTDTVFKAMQKIRGSAGSGFAEPTGLVIHPADWTDVKLLKDTTGNYIFGGPADEGPERIWGLLVRQTTGITEGTGLVGAFRPHSEVLRREGLTITMSTEHASYFVENKVGILAETRLALAVYRPTAFCSLTGI